MAPPSPVGRRFAIGLVGRKTEEERTCVKQMADSRKAIVVVLNENAEDVKPVNKVKGL